MNIKAGPDTRARIIAAAEELTCKAGASKLALDAVAARAGVSKGGLLYHFPSKHALLRALVARHVAHIRQEMEELAPGCLEAGEPPTVARAYLRVMRGKLCAGDPPPAGIFAAIAEDPEFIAPVRELRAWLLQEAFQRCPDPARATVAFLACEGLLHLKLTDAQDLDGSLCAEMFDALELLLEGMPRKH